MIDFEKIAEVCHEVNRAACAAYGDHSQKPWAEAEEWQRESAIVGVKFLVLNPDAPESLMHGAGLKRRAFYLELI